MKYDDASWHFNGDYPKDLPQENAYTHIGVFLAWAIHEGVVGELHTQEWPEEVDAVKSRSITGPEFLLKNCDGKLTDEDFNELGNKFASAFYDDYYFGAYVETTDPDDIYESVYQIPDSWDTYDLVAPHLSYAYEHWKKSTNNK